MAINSTMQLLLLIYDYLYTHGNKVELTYRELLDKHYADMFRANPVKYIKSDELFELLQAKARFDEFTVIQKEMYQLLEFYKDSYKGE